jgi:flagellar M-ring protein FliF
MDWLARVRTQLRELYRSMTPGSRLTSLLLIALLALGIVHYSSQQTVRPEVDLLHGRTVSASQLSIMEAALGKANLTGYQIRGNSIFAPQGQEAAYLAALVAEKALPPDFGDVIMQTAKDVNIFVNPRDREEQMKVAKQTTLANMICDMPGVERAYVLYDVDKADSFDHHKTVTAMACVKPIGAAQLADAQVSAIRALVAGAYAGLTPERVVVSDLNGRTWTGATVAGAGSDEKNNYVMQKRAYESDLKSKILNALSYIPSVTVELNVEFERERSDHVRLAAHLVASRVPPENDVERSAERMASKTRQAAANDNLSAPASSAVSALGELLGSTANAPSAANSAARANAPPEKNVSPNGVINTAPGSAPGFVPGVSPEPYEEKDPLRLTPISARVSVGVPNGYFVSVWRIRNPDAPGQSAKTPDQASLDRIRQEEIGNIQRRVAPLLPPTKLPASIAELVTVTVFQELPSPEPPVVDPTQIAIDWLKRWRQELIWAFAGLVALLALRSIIHDKSKNNAAAEAKSEPDEQNEEKSELDQIDEIVDAPQGDQAGKAPAPHWKQHPSQSPAGPTQSPMKTKSRNNIVAKDKDHATPAPHSPPAVEPPLREELSALVEDDPEAAAKILRNWIGRTS